MNYKTYHIFFSKLANPLRIKIVSALEDGDKSVSELIAGLRVEQSKLSHALGELRDCNIVEVEQKGKERIYSLSRSILPILKLIELHSKKCSNCAGCRGCCD